MNDNVLTLAECAGVLVTGVAVAVVATKLFGLLGLLVVGAPLTVAGYVAITEGLRALKGK